MLLVAFLLCLPTHLLSFINYPRLLKLNSLNVSNKLDNTGLQIIDDKLPIYPYVDTPVNLFFGYKVSESYLFFQLDQSDKAGIDSYDDGLLYVIDFKKDQNKTYEFKPPYNKVEINSLENIDYYRKLNKLIHNSKQEYVEGIKVDLAEFDAICPGLGKWPKHKDILDSGVGVNTSLFPRFKPVKGLTSIPPAQPYRKEVKTIGEAILEQKKWLKRSKMALKDWNLDLDEMRGLPDQIRESYYRNRFEKIKKNPALVFELALKMRRCSEDVPDYHPMEFRYMEDSYTFTKSDCPITNEIYRWQDPLDSPWRLRVEELIKDAVSYDWPPTDLRVHSGLVVHDITWIPGIIKIFVKRASQADYVSPHVLGDVGKKEMELLYSKIGKI